MFSGLTTLQPKPFSLGTFTMLKNKMLSVNNTPCNVIAKLAFQCVLDNRKGMSFVMGKKVFDIFKQKSLWSFLGDNSGYIKEKGSLGSAFKTCGRPKAFFFETPTRLNG